MGLLVKFIQALTPNFSEPCVSMLHDFYNFRVPGNDSTKIQNGTTKSTNYILLWSYLNRVSYTLSFLNVFLKLCCLHVFCQILRRRSSPSGVRAGYTIVHVYFFLLTIIEILHQYCAGFLTLRRLYPPIFQSAYYPGIVIIADIVELHQVLLPTLFATRNYWIALVATVRCYILSHMFQVTRDQRPSILGQVGILTCIFISFSVFCLVSKQYAIPQALWCYSSKTMTYHVLVIPNMHENIMQKQSLTLSYLILEFFLPFGTIFVASIMSWHSVLTNTRNTCRRFRKTLLVISLLSTSYFLFEAPVFVFNICNVFVENWSDSLFLPVFVEIMSNMDSTVNVLIYILADSTFKKTTREIIFDYVELLCHLFNCNRFNCTQFRRPQTSSSHLEQALDLDDATNSCLELRALSSTTTRLKSEANTSIHRDATQPTLPQNIEENETDNLVELKTLAVSENISLEPNGPRYNNKKLIGCARKINKKRKQ